MRGGSAARKLCVVYSPHDEEGSSDSNHPVYFPIMEVQIVRTAMQLVIRKIRANWGLPVAHLLITGMLLTVLPMFFSESGAWASQTREQCDRCCKSSQQDDYYLEQCKLKCFRNPEHCLEQKGRRQAAPDDAETAAPPVSAKPRTGPGTAEPGQPPSPAPRVAEPARPEPPRPAPKPTARSPFVFPNPLNMVPGREWEAAGQILAANGISPQHPSYQAGLRAVEAVLIEFARANPGGGRLPTAQLEKIIQQLR